MSSQQDISPQKSLSRNLRISFPLSPLPDHALLPLTYDFIKSCIGWVQAGDVWALRVLYFYVCPKSACCSCVCHGLEARLHSLSSILDFLWRELFSNFPFFYGLLPLRAGLYLIVGFSFFNPLFCSFLQSYYHFLLHYFAISAVMPFNPSLLGSFGPVTSSSLNDSIWSLGLLLHYLWAPMSYLLPFGHPWPIYFP